MYFLMTTALWGADGQRYAPVIPEPEIPSRQNMPDVSRSEEPQIDENQVLLPNLKGLLFADDEKRLYAVSPEKTGIQVEAPSEFAFLQWPEFAPMLQKYLGKPFTVRQLRQMEKEIQALYKKHSISFVSVHFPQQDAESGTLQILLVEGKVGNVYVRGARYFDNQHLSKNLYVQNGNYLDENDVREDLIWLSRNPFREADIEIKQTDETGVLDVYYDINDMRPWRGTVGYTDTGTLGTGIERIFFGGTYGNLFGKSNLLNYQLTSSSDFKSVVNHSFTWMMPIPETRNYLSVRGNYATLQPNDLQDGLTWSTGFDLNRRLWTKITENHRRDARLSVGFEFLHTNTDLDVGGSQTYSLPVQTAQFIIGFDWIHYSEKGYVAFDTHLHISPGGFSKYNNTEYFQAFSGTESRSDYLFATMSLDMLRKCTNMDIHCRLFGQVSSAALIAYDQIGLGGIGSVRGYHQYTSEADGGFIMNLEFLTPSKRVYFDKKLQSMPPYRCLNKEYEDDLQFYTFLDVGIGIDWCNEGDSPDSYPLAGIGVGVKYSFGPWINIDLAYGFQLIDPDMDEYAKTGRPHVSIVFCR
ncbi:MAG: ShlB/FhaC/HecB family hemolysin secretion/activation protein [Planctomycetia bacterium]|nr:ShlB/FhaC/HecB family hemolysin secretion/activation protein [Planctomycetia bacterium]